jgi:hypothetical protein
MLAQRAASKALVGRAQGKVSQPPSLDKNKQAWREHVYRPMRAVKDNPAVPLGKGRVDRIEQANRWSPVLVQRAALEGWEGQPGRPPARGTRTIGMCSLDARNRGSTRRPLKMKWGIGKTRAVIDVRPSLHLLGQAMNLFGFTS